LGDARQRHWSGLDDRDDARHGCLLGPCHRRSRLLREAISRSHHQPDADPLAILDRRLAEGQISVDEYEQRKKTLAASSGATA
jgi:hypothetical protein